MKLKLDMHLNEANTQRRSMNAYITALKRKCAPDDPPSQFEPCHIPEFHDEILEEAIIIHRNSRNPVQNEEPQDTD